MYKYITIAILALSSFVYSCKENKDDARKSTKTPVPKVDAFVVMPKELSHLIEVPGSLAPFEETELHPEVSGRVTDLFLKEGTEVKAGTLLVKLYDADLQAQLRKLRVQLAIAQKTEERQEALLKINGISQEEYDGSVLAVNNIRADIDILKTSIAKTEIRAPFNGKIGLRNISMGAYITPQTIISTIRQMNALKLVFSVPERYSAFMIPGAIVHFTVEGSAQDYSATIIANENNITNDTRSLDVKAVVKLADTKLVPGAFAKVKIDFNKNTTALMIPTQAIIPQARNKKVIAMRNGITFFEIVTTGLRDSAMVEITGGLKAGDTVLISGLMSVKPSMAVKFNKIIKN